MCITLHISTLHFIYHCVAQPLGLCNTSQSALVLQVWITFNISIFSYLNVYFLFQVIFDINVWGSSGLTSLYLWHTLTMAGIAVCVLDWGDMVTWIRKVTCKFCWAIFKQEGRKSISWYFCQTWKLVLPLAQRQGECNTRTFKPLQPLCTVAQLTNKMKGKETKNTYVYSYLD